MNNSRLLELISRRLAGEASAEELEELDRMLSADADASETCKIIRQYWDQHENGSRVLVEEAYNKLLQRLDVTDTAPVVELQRAGNEVGRKRFYPAVAAALIILIAGLTFLIRSDYGKGWLAGDQTVLKENEKGVKRSFVLSDGSKIWLNAESKIQFPKAFTGNTREVYLNGEAFFEIAKNASKPFIVHLTNGTVSVLGTSFNIRAYDNEKSVETSVATGKVAFIPKYKLNRKIQDTVYLSPEKKVRYITTKQEVIVEATVSKEDRAWIAGKLVFKGLTFDEISMQLERNFGKKIVFIADTARAFRLTGSFQNNSLEEILFYLSKSKAFTYRITNNEVLIDVEARTMPQ